MMDKNRVTIGLLTAAHVRDPSDSVKGIVEKCRNLLESFGYKVEYNGQIQSSGKGTCEYVAELKRKGIDALILMPTNWVEPPAMLRPLEEIKHLPLMLWGFPETDEYLDKGLFLGSSSAFAVIKSALEQMDVRHESIMGMPDDQQTQRGVEQFFTNVCAAIELAKSAIGLIGYASMGIYTATFDQLYYGL